MRWYQRFFRTALTEKKLDSELQFDLEQQIADYVGGRDGARRSTLSGAVRIRGA
jgi:hypothetical protein